MINFREAEQSLVVSDTDILVPERSLEALSGFIGG